ncbi:MAG: MarR family winged helix-turn-helix transcriptional regulator [Chloroflexi bacterium]|nr:MarR family winged helix-turn-helix transcriptional regulator [Chloroflexota bacterium]MCC6892599.1 winged helix-turn-helix transcriptional regulator [Anaerolineae bacterium]
MPEVTDSYDDNIGRLLNLAMRDFQTRCAEKLHARGYTQLSATHLTILSYIEPAGSRIVTLAERAGMTKQSMGDLIRELEAQGYVERSPDPSDKRAVIIKMAQENGNFMSDAFAIMAEIQAEYAAALGGNGLDDLRGLLKRLLNRNATDKG